MTQTPSPRPPIDGIPREILCAQDYEALAPDFMAAPTHAYVAGGCGRDSSVAANREAFARRRIVPRLLRDMTQGHTRVELLTGEHPHPILLAPLAYQALVHPQAETDTARAAAATDTTMVVSTLATRTLEQIAAVRGFTGWFQLYFQPHRPATRDLVRRAEAAGYRALVVTLDATIKTPSLNAQRAGFVMPADICAENLREYPLPGQYALAPGQSRIFQGAMREAPTFDDLAWLLGQTRLPVVVKGVLHPDDALLLKGMGVAGLVVSNHGGRALDGAPASLDMLPAVRAAVGPGYPLMLDSGVCSGSDAFKALALGADAVMIGRLQAYALAVAGALGVAHMIKLMREELELCMAQAGCATLADIGPEMIFRYQKEEM